MILYQLTLETAGVWALKTSREELQRTLERIHNILFTDWERLTNFQDFAICLGGFLDVLLEKSFYEEISAESQYRPTDV